MASSYAANLNESLVPVEEFAFSGLEKQASKIFRCPVSWVQSTDKKRVVQGKTPPEERSYPFLVLTLTDVAEQDTSFNSKYLALAGTPVAVGRDNNTYSRVSLLPVQCSVTVEYYTNDVRALSLFTNRWMFARKLGQLNFNIHYGKTTLAIKVQGSGSLSFPVREANPSETQEYLLSTTLVMNSYLSSEALIVSDLANQVDIAGFLATEENMDTAADRPSAQFWSFPSQE